MYFGHLSCFNILNVKNIKVKVLNLTVVGAFQLTLSQEV